MPAWPPYTRTRQGHNAPSDNWIIFDGTSGSAVVVRIAPTKAKVYAPAAGANVMDLIDLDDWSVCMWCVP